MINIKNLTKYYEDKKILDNFNLHVEKGKKILVQGNSGIGKTTLLRCISGLESYNGSISVDGSLSYIFQENRFMPWLTIRENFYLPLRLKGLDISDYNSIIEDICKSLDVLEHLDKHISQVSGGQLQRLSIVQGMLLDTDVILLDEPLKSIEKELYNKVYDYIIKWATENDKTLIYVSHENVNIQDFDIVLNIE